MKRGPKILLVLGLLAVVGMAFRVSWNALRDIAHAIGADPVAATVYPLVVDGLMALALVAALVLPEGDRRFALRILAGYTAASLVLNYVHGLVPGLHGAGRVRLADWSPANWALVLLATSLPVGSIFYGSDLVAKVLHHRPATGEAPQTGMGRSAVDLGQPAGVPAERSADRALTAPESGPAAEPEGGVLAPADRPTGAPRTRRPRKPTGRVPAAARGTRPRRTPEELLTEARTATAAWPVERLTADRIREAVHTSPAKARVLRETLKAERAAAPAGLHLVTDPHTTAPDTAPEPEPAAVVAAAGE
ncbi:DUF2637 domain-containing protein [Streptacidiphilus sp. ASG 303]|uniref:DUF2637 domain-containing protein n=1 Tax=Streptacidiphilus sp. ASG 303 TaxID=2896847 RepID=UPI001E37D150|nr:DUF2637 domain-containing protein [Streptacidiphilus sp. ASG 303]MCD0482038.1 DUF2637 domain-containing protein [Streptacidiphilus sp. ASG 303]